MERVPGAGAAPAGTETAADRRRHTRIAKPPVHVSGRSVTVNDVSLGGIHLTLRNSARAGEQLELILTDAVLHYTETLEGEVVWARQDALGLRWVNLTDRQQKWLEERMDSWVTDLHRLVVNRR